MTEAQMEEHLDNIIEDLGLNIEFGGLRGYVLEAHYNSLVTWRERWRRSHGNDTTVSQED